MKLTRCMKEKALGCAVLQVATIAERDYCILTVFLEFASFPTSLVVTELCLLMAAAI